MHGSITSSARQTTDERLPAGRTPSTQRSTASGSHRRIGNAIRAERLEAAEVEVAIEWREWCLDQVFEHELGERVGIPIEPSVDELVSDETEE